MVYVDDPITIDPHFSEYCHLWADDVAELHKFAARLGLKRSWFQVSVGISGEFSHYDISPAKRKLALALGAKFIPLPIWIKSRRDTSNGLES